MYIKVKFENNYRAAGDELRMTAEWPPSPFRFTCAVVNAFHQMQDATGLQADKDILKKFIASPAPTILTKFLGKNYKYARSVWVENNFVGKDGSVITQEKGSINYTVKKSMKSFNFVPADEIYFRWEGAECVQHLFPWISHLGTKDSLVSISNAVPDGYFEVWEPNDEGRHGLRCSYDGMLDDLEMMHENYTPVLPLQVNYSTRFSQVMQGNIPSPPVQEKFFDDVRIFAIDAPFNVNLLQTTRLAECFRNAIGVKARELGLHDLELEIFNHEPKFHLSYVPLPLVRGPFADGSIKGVMICLPKSLSAFRDSLNMCLKDLVRVPFYLFDRLFAEVDVQPARNIQVLQNKSWVGPSKAWSSATPLECPFAKKKFEPALIEQQMKEWCILECARFGLPKPTVIKFFKTSFWNHYAGDFLSARRESSSPKTKSYLSHLHLEFPIAVEGPIMLGRGRNFGTGLMCPIDSLRR